MFSDGRLKFRYDQERDEGPAITALLMNPQDAGGLFISGMHSIIVAGRLQVRLSF